MFVDLSKIKPKIMEEKILLSTFIIRLKDRNSNDLLLSSIDGGPDFIDVFMEFTEDIFKNTNSSGDPASGHVKHLTLDSPATLVRKNRVIYGFLSSGVSGEKYTLIDTQTDETAMDVEPHHAAFRNVFFYIYLPRMKNTGYLVLQKKINFGIKGKFKSSLNDFIRKKEYYNFRVEVNNILHHKVYNKMMTMGKLKKVDLIKKRIPKSIEKYVSNGNEPEEIKGTLRTSITSRGSLPEYWKDYIGRLFNQDNGDAGTVEIQSFEKDYDDIEFELELEGKTKTFYVINKQRIQSDVNVTSNIEIVDGEPTIASLIQEAKGLIKDVSEISPS
ncbi:MAG: hypothetical protein QM504_11050 [Pseudomonadota bacterium]